MSAGAKPGRLWWKVSFGQDAQKSASKSFVHVRIRPEFGQFAQIAGWRQGLLETKEASQHVYENYAHYRRTDPGFDIVLFGLIVLTLGGSIVNLIRTVDATLEFTAPR